MQAIPQKEAPLRRSFIRFPTQVEFGVGILPQIGELSIPYGKRAYCLFDPFLKDPKKLK